MGKLNLASALNRAHKQLFANLQLEETAKKDRIVAQQLQIVLQTIKRKQMPETSDPMLASLAEQAMELIEPSAQIFNAGRKGSNLSTNLFRRTHSVKTSYGGDDILEEEFAAVIAALESAGTGRSVSLSSHLVGSEVANIAETELSEAMQKTMQRLLQRFNKTTDNALYTKPVARSGKADVTGLELSLTADVAPEWEQLFSLFQGRTFSLKNYSSYSQTLEIHLGNTDVYKALYAVLSAAGFIDSEIQEILIHGFNSIIKPGQNAEIASLHFYHMRYIYELTGVGLYADGEKLSGVDFLIYNDPGSDNIFVRSTADIILEMIDVKNNTLRQSLFSNISIPKARFN